MDPCLHHYSLFPEAGVSETNTLLDEWLSDGLVQPTSVHSPHSTLEVDRCLYPMLSCPIKEIQNNTISSNDHGPSTIAAPPGIGSPAAYLSSSTAWIDPIPAMFIPQQETPPTLPTLPPHAISALIPAFCTGTSRKRAGSSDSGSTEEGIAIKRQKNTNAARRSRLRKVEKMETLEHQVYALEEKNTHLLLRLAVLDSEKSTLISTATSFENRISELEAQLAHVYQTLTLKPG
ncbi:hypothetical protein BDF14DRAFT_1749517 [Spinellus fusiger]|nr:hypothetical protein BDF14DRAFT_1749517 [Spinellus fusiger]